MTPLAMPAGGRPPVGSRVRDYAELSKARIVMMVLITTAAGFLIAAPSVDPLLLMHTLFGTALVAAG
ncbi:MAG TPA: protoheme IX farnesyltransferase, partial [Thermoanaerobaculia bacterium]|nr:protoheme IX farnesyltransferase [Thermoanaerobaculia bacterium]